MEQGIAPEFNRLSKIDRLKLKSSAMVIAMGGLMKDDTKTTPWKYPFYAGFAVFSLIPIPVLGIHLVPIIALYGWARLERTPWARKVNRHFRDSFNDAAVMDTHRHCLRETPPASGKFQVDNVILAAHTASTAYRDTKEATQHFWRHCRGYFGPDV